MRLPFFIARRYFLSRRSQRAVNIISLVSVAGVFVGTAALVIVLSVFNGFEHLVISLYDSFDPDLRVEAKRGKHFHSDALPWEKLKKLESVELIAPVIEENALVRYKDRQQIVTLKGVTDDFVRISGVDSMISSGDFILQEGDTDFAVIGSGIAYALQMGNDGAINQMDLYAPRRNQSSLLNPEESFNRRFIPLSGVFSIQQEYDMKYILVPYRFAREILEYDSLVSHAELKIKSGFSIDEAADEVKALIGNGFEVKSRLEQHEAVYRIMKSEKWAVFLILTFILIVATFNIVGTLSMLVIEKKKDIAVLYSMGAEKRLLQRIFLAEGMFINLVGSVSGMLAGTLICLGQQYFGWIKLGNGGTFVIDAYPVQMQGVDFFYVFVTVSAIGWLGAWYPAKKMVTRSLDLSVVRNDE
ncbi:MAG: ABC transporter permease [Bacteroidota bacterium]